MSEHFGTLAHASGSSRIASSAYQKWPTRTYAFEERVQLSNQYVHLTHLKFENRFKLFQLKYL